MSTEKQPETKSKWTIMVHLAGDNNLAEGMCVRPH